MEISEKKRLRTDYEWDLIDKKFRKTIFECHPKISHQMDEKESLLFWENALGIVYVRYGNELLKKYGKTDLLLIKIRDSLDSRKINIKPAVKRLCREWPVLYGSSEEDISDQIKDAFEFRKKKKMLGDSLNY